MGDFVSGPPTRSAWLRGALLGLGLLPAATLPRTRSEEPPATAPAPAAVTVEQLAERLKAMEETNRRLAEQLERSNREHQAEMRKLLDRVERLSTPTAPPAAKSDDRARRAADDVEGPAPSYETQPMEPEPGAPPIETGGVPEFSDRMRRFVESPAPPYETQPIEFDMPAAPLTLPPGVPGLGLRSRLANGFMFETPDEEFLLQVHIQSQVEARIWGQTDQTPVTNGFFFPRQRVFFNGRMTKPIEYVFSFHRGFGELNILEAYLNFNFDERLQFRFGRYFTPITYDQFAIRNLWLPTPERSLFTTNVALNRQIGAMAWGYLLDKRLDYAAGIFNGPRNSFEDFNNAKDFVGFLNFRPFQTSEALPWAQNLNVGSSVAYGSQDQPAIPRAFRIGASAPSNAEQVALAAAPFLTLNSDVREKGERLVGSIHMAYFYKGLSLLGEYQYGHAGYASRARPTPVEVPFNGAYLTAAYFLTGEHIMRRAMVEPLRPVTPHKKGERFGPGAWELVGRVSELGFGEQVFNAGFADPNLWTNRAVTTEVGLNWYWNQYLKIYMFWLHGDFADPVYYRPGRLQQTADMFWLRCQLFF